MTDSAPLDATVLIATYNRAVLLDRTIDSLATLRLQRRRWEVIVVDNNSTDDTRAVVERHAAHFPVPLRYLHEPRQGRSSALNAGIAGASGLVIAMTDDDVRVDEMWLEAACAALLGRERDSSIGYAGGPVAPMWEVPPPAWLDQSRGDLWGTIAIQNHGESAFVYEDARRVPLGANMAVRRGVFAEVGLFRADLGRSNGSTLLGQEVPELLMRVRGAGYRGVYLPAMRVHHHIPAARLTPRYFQRWWFGKGVSRATLERMQPITDQGVDLRTTPHIFGVPRYMYGTAARDAMGWLRARLARRPTDAFRHRMMLAYFAGYVRKAFRPATSPRTPSVPAGGRLA